MRGIITILKGLLNLFSTTKFKLKALPFLGQG